MSFASQGTQKKLPFPYNDVFDGLVTVIPMIGFSLKSQDRVIGRITVITGMSLYLTIAVEKVDDSSTLIGIQSPLKVEINVADAHEHTTNFNRLIESLNTHLQSRGREQKKGWGFLGRLYLAVLIVSGISLAISFTLSLLLEKPSKPPSPIAKTSSPTAKTPSPTAKTPSPIAKIPSPTAKIPSPTAKIPSPSPSITYYLAINADVPAPEDPIPVADYETIDLFKNKDNTLSVESSIALFAVLDTSGSVVILFMKKSNASLS